MAETTSKLQEQILALSHGKVDIMLDANTFKSTTQILREMSEAYEHMTDIERAAALELLGGKRQANVLSALIDNFDIVEDAIEKSENSAGSALKENEKVLNSIQGRINQFTNAVQTFWSNLLDSDVIKFFVTLATNVVKAASAFGELRTAIAVILMYVNMSKKYPIDFAGWIFGKDGADGIIQRIGKIKKELSDISNYDLPLAKSVTSTTVQEPMFGEQVDMFSDDYQNQIKLNAKIKQLKDATSELKSLQNMKSRDVQIPDDALSYKQGNRRSAYLHDVLIPNKQAEIDALNKDIDDITKTINVKVKQSKTDLIEDLDGQLMFDLGDMSAVETQTTSMLSALSAFKNVKLEMPDMNEAQLASVMDTINTKTTEGQGALLQYFSTLGDGDQALQAYIASLNGGKASLSGFHAFLQAHNANLVASGVKARMAAIGHMALNAALSMGLSVIIQLVMEGFSKLIERISAVLNPTKTLSKELSDLSSEISDIESKIDSLNSELVTTKERITELSALPSLSFVEQEELSKLKSYNDELERNIRLEEENLKTKNNDSILKSEKYIKKSWNNQGMYYVDNGVIKNDSGWSGFWSNSINTTDAIDKAFTTYKKRQEDIEKIQNILPQWDSMEEWQRDEFRYKQLNYESLISSSFGSETIGRILEDEIDHNKDILTSISNVLNDEQYAELHYGLSKDIDAFLDERYAYQLKLNQLNGTSSKSDALTAMFDATATKEMQEFGKALQEIADSDLTNEEKNAQILQQLDSIDGVIGDGVNNIDNATDAYNRLFLAMDIVGVTAQDIADYFVLETGTYNSSTIDGIIAQYELGLTQLKAMQDDESLFDQLFDTDGEVDESKIAEILNGADETTRKEFARLIKTIKDGAYKTKDGLIDWEKAIESFSISGGLRGIELAVEHLSSMNIDIFPGLEEEISGIIDTFDELIAAVGNTVDALNILEQARAEEAYSGSVSLETLERLMQSTDNYADLIEVDETGAIKLATNAHDILVQEKIDTIKKNAQLALSSAKLQLEEAKHNQQIYNESSPAQEVLRSALAEVGAAAAFVTSLWNDLSNGNFDGAWNRAKEAASAAKIEKNNSYAQQASQAITSVAKAEQAVADAEKMAKIANNLTPENITPRYDSDTASGGAGTTDEVNANAFQADMEYWERQISASQAKYDQIQNEIDMLEKKGKIVGQDYYEVQIQLEKERYSLLLEQQAAAEKYLGTFQKGSDEWWEAAETLNSIESELDDVTASIDELRDAQDQVKWTIFEEFHDRFGNLTNQLQTVRDLLSADEDSFFDDEGQWSEKGVAVLGTYVQELEMYQSALADVEKELGILKSLDANDAFKLNQAGFDSEQEYYDKLTELSDLQQDYLKTISDTKYSVLDMYESQIDAVEDYTSELIDKYNDYVDVVKDTLDAERDLHDFRKSIEEKSTEISNIERRIASLSGSDDAADIAERRKLEAELYKSQSDLEDAYYDHAKDSQQEALDDESKAYEDAMNNYVDKLRDTLDEASKDMNTFMETVSASVLLNADIIKNEYTNTGVVLDDALVTPWDNAINAMSGYEINGLAQMNAWTSADGYFGQFDTNATYHLESPWKAGQSAINAFQEGSANAMKAVVDNIHTNVVGATGELEKIKALYAEINSYDGKTSNGGTGSPETQLPPAQPQTEHYAAAIVTVNGKEFSRAAKGETLKGAKARALESLSSYVISYMSNTGNMSSEEALKKWKTEWQYKVAYNTKAYAKGTLGTKKNGLALTDEPQFGDELVLVPTAQGNLSYMRKGTSVVPADITKNLVEWGQFSPNNMHLANMGSNITAISNAIVQPNYDFNFDSLVHVDHCDEGTLKNLEKMVDNKINDFSKQLNYSIKKFAR